MDFYLIPKNNQCKKRLLNFYQIWTKFQIDIFFLVYDNNE